MVAAWLSWLYLFENVPGLSHAHFFCDLKSEKNIGRPKILVVEV